MRRPLLILAGTLAALYLLLIVALYGAQRWVVFPAPREAITPPLLGGAELWRLPQEKGAPEVLALYRKADPEFPTLVYFHGNGEQLSDTGLPALLFGAAGLGFLAVEYPGYGLAAGTPNEQSCYAAAATALAHLHRQEAVLVADTVLVGHSLGTGVATEMAARGLGQKLVLLAPFGSIAERGAAQWPLIPSLLVDWLVRDRFDNTAKAANIALPTFVLHGTDDEVIPVAEGKRLAARFPAGRFFAIVGGHHNDLFRNRQLGVVDQVVGFALDGRHPLGDDLPPEP